uniref:Uncharacterized protein n=1 Tax=Panagrolaimus sp. JU765 TaxID=591449 RepID=A0AC34PZU5_9BILA
MVKFIGFFLIFLTFANSGLSVPVPINGQVQIFTNLPKYSSILDSLKNTLSGSSFKTTIVPKTTNFCSFVNENFHNENDDLLLLISESSSNVEDFCNNNQKSPAIQVSVFVDQLQFRFKNHRGQTTTLPKAKIDGNVVDSYMNSIFYNLFESKYLQGTSFSDVEIVRYGFLDFPSWVWLIIGAAISTYIVRHNQHAISETTAALAELEEYKPRELRVAPKKNY